MAAFTSVLRAAEAIVACSQHREESRGAYLRADFPDERPDGASSHTAVQLVGDRLRVFRRPVGSPAIRVTS